jgi:hypothetical protein
VTAIDEGLKPAGAKVPVGMRAGRNGKTRRTSKLPDAEITDYLRDKIEFRVAHYETQLQKVDGEYATEVAKLAKRTKDPALAYRLQQIAEPTRIAADLQRIRKAVAADRLIEADGFLEQIRSNFEFLDWHLRRRYMTAGFSVVRGGEKAAKARWQRLNTAGRDSQMREMWQRERGQGLSKGKADKKVAKEFGRSLRTVRTARLAK